MNRATLLQLDDVFTALLLDEPLPLEFLNALRDALRARLLGGEAPTLEAALGWAGTRGRPDAVAAARMARRNAHLAAAFRLVDGATDLERRRRLGQQLRRARSTWWPHHRHLPRPPDRFSMLRRHLWWAFRLAAPADPPSSPRGLHEAIWSCNKTAFHCLREASKSDAPKQERTTTVSERLLIELLCTYKSGGREYAPNETVRMDMREAERLIRKGLARPATITSRARRLIAQRVEEVS